MNIGDITAKVQLKPKPEGTRSKSERKKSNCEGENINIRSEV
jgi:hypothetical protein